MNSCLVLVDKGFFKLVKKEFDNSKHYKSKNINNNNLSPQYDLFGNAGLSFFLNLGGFF